MTATQFRRALESLGLSQVGASRLFCVTDRVVRMWAANDRPVPELVAKVLRLMLAGKLSVEDVADA